VGGLEIPNRPDGGQQGGGEFAFPKAPGPIHLGIQRVRKRDVFLLLGDEFPNCVSFLNLPGGYDGAGAGLAFEVGGDVGFDALEDEGVGEEVGEDEAVEAVVGGGVKGDVVGAGCGVDVELRRGRAVSVDAGSPGGRAEKVFTKLSISRSVAMTMSKDLKYSEALERTESVSVRTGTRGLSFCIAGCAASARCRYP
jgi:hypothetical protein